MSELRSTLILSSCLVSSVELPSRTLVRERDCFRPKRRGLTMVRFSHPPKTYIAGQSTEKADDVPLGSTSNQTAKDQVSAIMRNYFPAGPLTWSFEERSA